ncbi:MAG: HAMP domain-containing histidine kinase [Actinobacteria bacterium]|nr:MAG: HAMP domain-containing histidine kinase [Actinomycetota bacterium]
MLRRRLTIVFMLAVGVSAAALAAGSYVVVRHNLLADSVNDGARQGRRNLVVAPTYLRQGSNALIQAYRRSGDFETVGVTGGKPFSSSFSVGLRQVPADLRRLVASGKLGYERETVAGTHYLVVGGPSSDGTELYFFFSEQNLRHELAQLRNVLLIGVGILMLLAGFVGAALARRTLRPVARASTAAHSLAEGLLETRLPVTGRDEFGAWAQAFNEMASALEAKISALSAAQARERRFTADVAHELRTPLTALVGEASLLSDHVDSMPTAARRPAELLIGDIARLRRLVEDLMEISRFDAGRESVQTETVDLASLAAGAIRARGWEGQVRLDADDVVLQSDPRRLERIVANLVGNALDHGGHGVAVRVGQDGVGAFVEVVDRGPGIAPEHLVHLFERFYKSDASRSGRGTGLGLAIALENARLLGGEIEVWSELGEGSRFTLRLPTPEAVTQTLRSGDGRVSAAEEHDLQDERRRSP